MPRKSRKNVGLIGLGIIGSRVAAGLRQSGFHVFVWNRTAKPAPNFVGSPAEIAEICDIIQLFVADAAALFDVIEQMKDSLGPQHVVICSATVGPEATLEAARVVEETGAHFLDAPFTGSKGAAEKRSLVYYIGGDEATFLRARPVLEATSKAIVRIGGIGHAATVKVVTNMISAVTVQTLGEALAIVQKAGLDPEVLAAALEQNACRSGVVDLKLPKMMSGDYEPHFSLKHMFKDVQLGIHIANALDIEIPATTVTAGVMYGALNQGWGDLDYAALYKIYQPQPDGTSAAELQSGFAQIEDLDAKEVHYPDTKVAAPPRPGSEPEPEPLLSVPEPGSRAEEEPKLEAPSLAAALGAPEELKPTETPAPADEPKAEASEAPANEAAPSSDKTAEAEPHAHPPEPAPPTTHIVLPGHIQPPGVIHLAPIELHAAAAEAGALSTPEPPLEIKPAPIPREPVSEGAPESGKVVDFPPPQTSAGAAPAEPTKDEPKPATVPAGDLTEPAEEGGAKPFNFVKRWFVSRGGG